jgi:hypothetical protein
MSDTANGLGTPDDLKAVEALVRARDERRGDASGPLDILGSAARVADRALRGGGGVVRGRRRL